MNGMGNALAVEEKLGQEADEEIKMTVPSSFRIRLMVRSEGKPIPDLLSSHLMAEAPICANDSDSSLLLTFMIRYFSISGIRVELLSGALD